MNLAMIRFSRLYKQKPIIPYKWSVWHIYDITKIKTLCSIRMTRLGEREWQDFDINSKVTCCDYCLRKAKEIMGAMIVQAIDKRGYGIYFPTMQMYLDRNHGAQYGSLTENITTALIVNKDMANQILEKQKIPAKLVYIRLDILAEEIGG